MTIFNTQAAKNVAKDLHTSFDIAKAVVTFLGSEAVKDLNSKLVITDVWNIIDDASRHGAYQVFSGGPSVSLSINGNKLRVVKLPIVGKVVFTLTNEEGFSKTTSNINVVKSFLTNLVNDEANARMFTK